MPRLMAKPSPTPRPLSLVVKNGSKIWAGIRGNAGAVVAHLNLDLRFSLLKRASIQRLPPRGIASMAFMISASSTCSICAGSHCTRRQILRDLQLQLNSTHLQLMTHQHEGTIDHG